MYIQRETENLGMREHHLVAAERLHRQAEARDHVAAQQRAAYYAATAPPTQQVSRPSSVPASRLPTTASALENLEVVASRQ